MGAWGYVAPRIETATRVLNGKEQRPEYVGRRAEAAPGALPDRGVIEARMLGCVCRGGRNAGRGEVGGRQRGAPPLRAPPASPPSPRRMPGTAQLAAPERVARLLDTGLSRDELAAVVALVESGASPEVRVGLTVASGAIDWRGAARWPRTPRVAHRVRPPPPLSPPPGRRRRRARAEAGGRPHRGRPLTPCRPPPTQRRRPARPPRPSPRPPRPHNPPRPPPQ